MNQSLTEENKTILHFTDKDLKQIKEHGLSTEEINRQLETFKKGIPFVKLKAPAVPGNGILQPDEKEVKYFIDLYETSGKEIIKFVPASGAASRMFKILHQFLDAYNPDKESLESFLEKTELKPLKKFFEQMDQLPFFNLVLAEMQTVGFDNSSKSEGKQKYNFVRFLFEKMGYEELPKGLIPFHHYPSKTLTAFEEHLVEAVVYAAQNGKAKLHFTISPEHRELFDKALTRALPRVEKDGIQLEVGFSYQNPSTDTIAVDKDNEPFRDEEGKLVFRPGGHGALIQNLNETDADIVFIKNIDNVVPEKDLEDIVRYKKLLAGYLVDIQKKIFSLLRELEDKKYSENIKEKAEALAQNIFGIRKKFSSDFDILSFFDRPIRVCGMVKNEGEPGGGPFWIEEKTGNISLQIVESAQIDLSDMHQEEILSQSTHFNPVDLVCGIRDYKGQKFDLLKFVNKEQGFISNKSQNGRELKALELPGLWNGGMAYWNTVFVEVPLSTFNPVKTVMDLLKPGHQV